MKKKLTVAILLSCAAGWFWWSRNESATPPSAYEAQSEGGASLTDDTDRTGGDFSADSVVAQLVGTGWPHGVANSVVAQNSRRYALLHSDAPDELERELSSLARLKVESELASVLEEDPSLAGLLCLANQPALVAKSLLMAKPGTEHYERIKGTFIVRIEGAEIDRWAKVLGRHGSLVGSLIQGGVVQPEPFFAYQIDESEASVAYGEWLEDLFRGWPDPMSDDSFGLRCAYVANFGSVIVERMARDELFRSRFLSDVWPALVRLSDDDPGILFCAEGCGVWDLLLLHEDAERLLQRAGVLAAELLAGNRPVPEGVREEVAQYLLESDWRMLGWITRYRDEPTVISMMERDAIGPLYLPSVFERLDARGDGYPEELRYLSGLGDDALREELKPIEPGAVSWVPGYSTYVLIRKSSQGRRVDGMDWFGAGLDVVSFIPVLTATKGGKVAIQKLASKAGKEGLERTSKKAALELGKRAGDEIAKAADERQLTSVFANKVIGALSKETRESILSQGQIDITAIVRSGFETGKKLNLNRESFKKLTDLDAQVFMRKDGRVYVSLPELVAGRTRSAEFINEAAITITAAGSVQSVDDAYGEHVAAWWLAHASGNLESPTQ